MQVREPQVSINDDSRPLAVVSSALHALKRGDSKIRLPMDWEGTAGRAAEAFNEIAERNQRTDAEMVEILGVLKALRRGDASVRLPLEWTGLAGRVAEAFNEVVETNARMSEELTRLSRVVGKEGQLDRRGSLGEVSGFWNTSIESVNALIEDLVHPTAETARVIGAVAKGDLSQLMTTDVDGRRLQGEFLRTAKTVNKMVDQLGSFASEVTRVAREVGTEGKLGGQAKVKGVSGIWKDLTDSVNSMAGNLTDQVRNIADVTTAVASGDLSKKITVDVKGEILELKDTINTMVDQLRSFASEVTRVAREVGTEGKLGGQADVKGVAGTWKDLTDSVNSMAGNLTSQVRGIAKVVTAVANGDLKQELTVEAKGEIAALAKTINAMTDTLATFADQVTTVAREVGVEGKLGGQAKVPGAAGTWKALTENVNQLAANLTTQVRAIAEVATAVTKGDLTRSIAVEALGEVAVLKDTINEMIRNLKDTTQKNTEQDWLKTNLAKFSRMLQGQKDLNTVGRLILSELCPVVAAHQAEFYVLDTNRDPPQLVLLASYGSEGQAALHKRLDLGQGLVGQCAIEKRKVNLTDLPTGYVRISSGLGEISPGNLLVLPVVFEGEIKGVLELASLEHFNPTHQAFLDQLTESIGIVLKTIEANMRTEDLLSQSQSLAEALQSRQQELQTTNQELQEKARLLVHQNQEVERKNQEVEQARQALEEKAKQLALTSKYKSEFLANMSHELRTPLNSLLILSDQLCKNPDGNLTRKQTDFAKTIHSSGKDLLTLINDILDLSKIESGTVVVDPGELRLDELQHQIERTFRPVAESRSVGFVIRLHPQLPASMLTDAKRLQQILKNMLSNAFKFTHHGQVTLSVGTAEAGWDPSNQELNGASQVLAFSVTDTGIGIPPDKQQIIFEAFQQADGSTSRKYGGTGLGLAISRELSRLLGGEIRLTSNPGKGSTFTLYLPQTYVPRPTRKSLAAEAAGAPGSSSASRSGGGARTKATAAAEVRLEPAPEVPVLSAPELDLPRLANEAGDDRDSIQAGDRVFLIIENDLGFARVLLDAARDKGFKGLVAPLGATALPLAREYQPVAITLDIFLPDIDGWRVLDRLKGDLGTRHIPVHVISTDDARERALCSGALDFVAKPIMGGEVIERLLDRVDEYARRATRRVVVMEPNAARFERIAQCLQDETIELVQASANDATLSPDGGVVDCLVASPHAPGFSVRALAQRLRDPSAATGVPLVVYDENDDVDEQDADWKWCQAHALVRRVCSPERLLDQVSLFLHRSAAMMPPAKRGVLEDLNRSARVLSGRKALIVDDDIRNIFALTSVLEEYGMSIVSADNGHDAVHILKQPDHGIDIVLMDIMMPEMDGIDTMQEIRRIPTLRSLPIIAVTAKAMKGDRERCIEAGAWDYLAKPVDTDQMLAVLRAWLYR